MRIAPLTETDAEDAISFIKEGTATPWAFQSWVNNRIVGAIARDSNRLVGILPLRPRKVLLSGRTLTAYYCTAVRVAESHRGTGLGSEMLKFAEAYFCDSSSFMCVVRSDPESAAFNWYRKNGFVVVAEISSHDVFRDVCLTSEESERLSISGLDDVALAVSKSVDGVLSQGVTRPGAVVERRSVDAWRRDLKFHYYSQYYSSPEIFSCGQKDGHLVGLVAFTRMRSEPRFDVLDFEYENPRLFLQLADVVSRQYSSRYGVPVRWNLGSREARRLGVKSSWIERWRTNLMLRTYKGMESIGNESVESVDWRYRQIEFV